MQPGSRAGPIVKACSPLLPPTSWLLLVQWGDGDRAAWLQSWLICVEMFLAALAHAYAFPPRDYIDPARQHVGSFAHNVKAMFDVRVRPGFASS